MCTSSGSSLWQTKYCYKSLDLVDSYKFTLLLNHMKIISTVGILKYFSLNEEHGMPHSSYIIRMIKFKTGVDLFLLPFSLNAQ